MKAMAPQLIFQSETLEEFAWLFAARHLLTSPLLILPIPPIYLLLQHNAIHTSLEQRKRQTCLALQFSQAVEDFRGRVGSEVVEGACELPRNQSVFFHVRPRDLSGKSALNSLFLEIDKEGKLIAPH